MIPSIDRKIIKPKKIGHMLAEKHRKSAGKEKKKRFCERGGVIIGFPYPVLDHDPSIEGRSPYPMYGVHNAP